MSKYPPSTNEIPFGTPSFCKNQMVEEASTLEWPPGLYKESFEYEGRVYKFASRDIQNGELVAWIYKSEDNHKFVVLND